MRQTLVSWAATSSFLILAVVALRAALGRRMGAGLRYALWGLVLLRLLVPVQLFSSPVLGTVIDTERMVTRETVTEREALDAIGGQDGPTVVVSATPVVPSPPTAPDPPSAPDPPDWREIPAVLGWLWLAGACVMAMVLLGCNVRFYLRLRRARQPLTADGYGVAPGAPGASRPTEGRVDAPNIRLPVYVADGLPSPCLFGVFRPAIYVAPETAADPAALRHVLAHEGTHASHGDHIWSLLRCAALAIHWWNPLVWLAVKLSRRDGELACDEGALKRLGDGERAAYGSTLLALVTAKAAPGELLTCSTAMNGDKKSLKERFARIARAPKRAVGIAVAAVILASLVTVCAFGQKAETPAPWEELDADLIISMEDDSTVRITGTVDGMTLVRRGAFWHPGGQYSFSGSHYGELSLVYPDFTDGIEGHLLAWWADEAHTAVNLSTYMTAMYSSYFPVGYWEFTVDFSGGGAEVSRMERCTVDSPGGEAEVTRMERGTDRDISDDMEVRMYPKAISDEEAVRAGRIAARLLTEAEEFYRDWEEKGGAAGEAPAASESPTPAESPSQDESPAPSESPTPSESPAPDESEDPTASHSAGLTAASAEDPADMAELPYHPDLDRNGVKETLLVGYYYETMDKDWYFPGLGVWEDGELLWTSIGKTEGGTKTAYLLTEQDGEEYLMECSTWSGDGRCTYSYLGYDLRAPGQQSIFNGDTHFTYARGEYDEYAIEINEYDIADFMENINSLLSRSTVLYGGGEVFADPENPRLELSWLEHFAPGFTWDRSAPDLENLTRFEEAANRPNLAPAPVDPARARAELREALLGQREFVFYSASDSNWTIVPAVAVDINAVPQTVFPLTGEYGEIWSFAVIDLDGDGNEEVVLDVGGVAGDAGGYLVLHWAGPGDVRAHPSYWRTFWNLKTDGTFYYDYYMDTTGIGQVSFPDQGYAMVRSFIMQGQADMSTHSDPPEGIFTVRGETVTYEEYLAALDKQDEKPDEEWYEFTPENVKKALG